MKAHPIVAVIFLVMVAAASFYFGLRSEAEGTTVSAKPENYTRLEKGN